MAGLKQLKLRLSMKLEQYYQSLRNAMVQWWLLLQNSLQYSDGRVEIVDVPKAFSVGDVVAVTHRRDGGVVVQRVSPVVPRAYMAIDIMQYLVGLTPGATSQIRFKSKITKNPGVDYVPTINWGPLWHYSYAYDEHYASEYWQNTKFSDVGTSYTDVESPEFICPTNGNVIFRISLILTDEPTTPYPIYFTDFQILIGETWTDFTNPSFYSGVWDTYVMDWDFTDPSEWIKLIFYGCTAEQQAESGEGLIIEIV